MLKYKQGKLGNTTKARKLAVVARQAWQYNGVAIQGMLKYKQGNTYCNILSPIATSCGNTRNVEIQARQASNLQQEGELRVAVGHVRILLGQGHEHVGECG
jgi:hypothetical protein